MYGSEYDMISRSYVIYKLVTDSILVSLILVRRMTFCHIPIVTDLSDSNNEYFNDNVLDIC